MSLLLGLFERHPASIALVFWLRLSASLEACELPPPGTAGIPAGEFRGLWVDAFGPGFFTTNEVTKLVRDCRQYNFNALIVEMRRRGDAFYLPQPPNPDPRTTALPDDFDALAEIIKQCHTGTPRVEVHCWVVSHFIWAWKKPPEQPSHVFNLHPEYLTKDSIGQKWTESGYFLDPGSPEANQWIYNVAKDIVSRYDIDGLHWDYCRYPGRDSGYNEKAIKRYNEEFGLNGKPAPNDLRFCEWRRRQVTDFLRWVSADMLEIKPKLIISAAVFGNLTDARGYRFSDWAEWTKQGIVDLCLPMDFSSDNQHIFNPRVDEAWRHQGNRYVYVGQAAYKSTKENTLAQLNYIRNKGFLGEVFYSYRSPNDGQPKQNEVFSFIKEQFQSSWTTTPPLPWKKTKGIIKGTVRGKQSGEAVYNALVTLTEPVPTQKTEPHGKFAFFDVAPGTYTITADAGPLGRGAQQVQVKGGEVISVDLSCETQEK